jgi:hypothetical protein
MQAGTTPKKRTSLNGRAALKLMRLDGARRAHQAASDARVTKAVSSIAVALLLISSGASATECQSSPGQDGKWWSWRIVDSKRSWYEGRPGRSKDQLHWAKQSPPPIVTRPDPGDSPPPAPPVPPQQPTKTVDAPPKVVSTVSPPVLTSKPPQMAAPPSSLPEPPPLPAKPTKPSKWWMLLLIIPAIATGLAVVASQFHPARKERSNESGICLLLALARSEAPVRSEGEDAARLQLQADVVQNDIDPCSKIGCIGPHCNGDLVLLLADQAKLELDTSCRVPREKLAQFDLAAQTGE